MSKKYLAAAAVPIMLVVAGAALAASRAGGPVVKTPGMEAFVPNQYAKDTMHFAPGTITVKSGGTVTFEDTSPNEPHTVTLGTKAQMPRSFRQRCVPCEAAMGHLKDPNDEEKGVKTYVLNKGKPGFDVPGDSVFLASKGPHKTANVVISAPPGTTLYFICALHPWMQGKIVVT